MPSPTLQAAILIAHDQLQERDYWRGLIDLRHLVDLRSILAQSGPLDGATLSALFESNRARRALLTQLETLRRLFPSTGAFGVEPTLWVRTQYNRRLLQIDRDSVAHLLTTLTLLIDPPLMMGRLRPMETMRERVQYLKRVFTARKPNKV